MEKEKPKIILAGGGTGGHVIPLLALAEVLKENFKVYYFGSISGPEAYLAPKRGLKFFAMPTGKLRRYFSLENFLDIFRFLAGFVLAFRLLKKLSPSLVFAKGGYVAFPVVLAARLLRLKIFIHESDSVLGFANRIASKFAEKIFLGFPPDCYPGEIQKKGIYSGIPTLEELAEKTQKKETEKRTRKDLILITGGSQGALRVNQLVLSLLKLLLSKYRVAHQTGKVSFNLLKDFAATLEPELRKRYLFKEFFPPEELILLRKEAFLAISRAGASTLFEQAKSGLPMILVPLSSSANNHQERNALYFAREGAAIVVDERLSLDYFQKIVLDLLENKSKLNEMAKKSRKLAEVDTLEIIEREILNAIKS